MRRSPPTFKFSGRYYTSGRGRQSLRRYNSTFGIVEITTASGLSPKPWYEVRVRNNGWGMGEWTGRDYESKYKAEKAVDIALKLLKKDVSKEEVLKNIPEIDWSE